jgi:hypothetical protein
VLWLVLLIKFRFKEKVSSLSNDTYLDDTRSNAVLFFFHATSTGEMELTEHLNSTSFSSIANFLSSTIFTTTGT